MTIIDHDPTLPACPDWCQIDGKYHHDYDEDPVDHRPVRQHIIEYDNIEASTARPARGKNWRPYAFVNVHVTEKSQYDHLEVGAPKVALAAEDFPAFTPAEARQLAAVLLEAADRADEIAGAE